MRTLPAAVCLLVALLPAAAPAEAPAEAPAKPPAAPVAQPAPAPGDEVTLVLKDGQALRGRLVARDDAGVTLSVAGTTLLVPLAGVREVAARAAAPATAGWARDPNRTRYLYGPSAFMLGRGEAYASQTELLLTTVAYGLTDHVTLQAGTSVPFLVYDPSLTPFTASLKVGGAVGGGLHLAGGFQAFVVPGLSSPALGFLFATVTWGDEDRHLSVSAGPPFLLSRSSSELGSVFASVAGSWRVSRGLALVSENWLIPADGEVKLVGSGALRLIGESLGVDVGLVWIQGSSFPGPWLDFTWHWD